MESPPRTEEKLTHSLPRAEAKLTHTLKTITFEPAAEAIEPYHTKYYRLHRENINAKRRDIYNNVSDEEKRERNARRRQKYLEKKEAKKREAAS